MQKGKKKEKAEIGESDLIGRPPATQKGAQGLGRRLNSRSQEGNNRKFSRDTHCSS